MQPQTIGIIMDGNRRWAKAKGLPVFMGHEHGRQTMRKCLDWAKSAGVKNIIFFAFSEENWNRAQEEVYFLIELIRKVLKDDIMAEIMKEGTRVRFAGNVSKFPADIVEQMQKIEKESEKNTDFNLVLCVSYGGRQEITNAFNELIKEGKTDITPQDISEKMYTAHIPDPDIIIRTSGEQRLSGFLLWQSTYSELFFTKTFWPDFSEDEFLAILEEYKSRERRIGK